MILLLLTCSAICQVCAAGSLVAHSYVKREGRETSYADTTALYFTGVICAIVALVTMAVRALT